jgi:hypothetical protein
MPDNNVIKFQRPPKKPTAPGKPSLLVAIVVAVIVIAVLAGGSWLISGRQN